jgi:cytochrome c5
MSQHHSDPVEENIETHPVKLAIAVVVGAVGLVVGIVLLAYFAVGLHRVGETEKKANTPEAIAQRIAPLTTISVDASKAPPAPALISAAPSKATAAPVVAMAIPASLPVGGAAASSAGTSSGEGTYKSSCFACHAAGIAGAPKTGDKATWGARIAKGKPVLYDHALKGFNGMPAKGGNTSLSDADVKAAVDYLVAQVK